MRTLSILLSFSLLIFFAASQDSSAQSVRPKIGLTLSGGAAKGLAHIGILKAIDSAGLKVDYISGTSMGGILGGLYAVGYSADSLEKIVRPIDWSLLLSNQSSLRSLFMEEKDEYSKYDIELPWVQNKLKLNSGLLEAQELWLKFSELFFPVYNIKDFSKFNISFRCVGTDIGNGETVIMKEGEIISAVRASMAIPSIFTAVDYNGQRLVDGGISRNFPVKDVKEMGADYVIGSNVAGGLLPSQKIRNIIQLLLQIAFFREADDAKNEIPLCDIYIPIKLDNFSMASFADADKILQMGIDEGRALYPRLKKLADSLDAIYGKQEMAKNRLPEVHKIKLSSYEVAGLKNTTLGFFINTMNLKLNRDYTAKELSDMVRQAFGTRYYNRIVYSLLPREDGSCKIMFNVEENQLTFAKVGLHYNRFSGIGLIANLTSRNLFISNSRSMGTVNIGESFRIKGEHLQYIGRLKNFGLTLKTQFDRFDVVTYEKYKQSGLYKQDYWEVSEKFHYSSSRNFTAGIGHRFEWTRYKPTIANGFVFTGDSHFSTLFAYLKYNSLDRNIFPRKGIKLEAEAARVLQQDPHVQFLINGVPPDNPDSLAVSTHAYYRTWVTAEGYLSLNNKSTFFLQTDCGINFNYSGNLMNEFIVGGITKLFHNQVTFAGLQEGTIYSPSLLMVQGGIRQQLFINTYVTGRANILLNNLISKSKFFNYQNFYSGYALTFSYNFALGPLDISVMYCDQTRKVQSYINLGIPF
ncbi:MAG: Patatin [Chitinophagaceae bacterium]|nr:Patatin [Chitinophagaceae bacterium]